MLPQGRGYIIVLGIENEENNDFLLYLVDIYVIMRRDKMRTERTRVYLYMRVSTAMQVEGYCPNCLPVNMSRSICRWTSWIYVQKHLN